MIRLPRELLERSPEETTRRLCLGLWAEAEEALVRLEGGVDGDALHDFRVALRRLRSVLRAYRRYLRGSRPKKLRRLVGALASSTNLARDIEVQLEWLEASGSSAARRLHARLAARSVTLPTAEALRKHFGQVGRPLARALGRMRLMSGTDEVSFLAVTGRLLREHAEILKARLDSIASAEEADKLHRTRIEAKRLRYLLEPLQGELSRARPLIKKMKGLQDCLGELQDTQVLTETIAAELEGVALEEARRLRDEALGKAGGTAFVRAPANPAAEPAQAPGPPDPDAGASPSPVAPSVDEAPVTSTGLYELLQAQRDRRDAAFETLRETWLAASGRAFFAELEGLADGLRRDAKKTKRFLLTALPEPVSSSSSPWVEVRQGFLPGKTILEEVRCEKRGRRVRYVRAVKLGRSTIEEPLTKASFDALWPLTEGYRLTRRVFELEDCVIHVIDQRDVVLAVLESVPEWLHPWLVREVTGSKRYDFRTLALKKARSAPERSPGPRDESP